MTAANGQPYVAVGRLLVERGEMPREQVTMARLRDWIEGASGEAGAALLRENPSYVFFREITGDGPIGSRTGGADRRGRSLAVDRAFPAARHADLARGASSASSPATIRRLVVAQDTGGAIKGPVRGDLFWGSGDAAAAGGRRDERPRPLLPAAAAARLRRARRCRAATN